MKIHLIPSVMILYGSQGHTISSQNLYYHGSESPRKIEMGVGEGIFPSTARDHYRHVYFEAVDTIISSIDQRFDQASYKVYSRLETLLLKAINKENTSSEINFIKGILAL